MDKVVVYSATRNRYADIVTAVKSLLFYTPVDRIYLLIEDDTFPYWMPEQVQTINVSKQRYFKKDGPNYNSHWTYMVLLRAALSKVLPDEHVVLNMDNDTLVHYDISDLWSYDLTDYYMAGVLEPKKSKEYQYINLGVVMMNLDKFRKDKMDMKAIKELNTVAHHFPEQDVLSNFCSGHILELPWRYNISGGCNMGARPIYIRHFAGEDNWRGYPEVRKWQNRPWSDITYAKGK